MSRRQKYTISQVEEALRLCGGIRGAAAQKLGCTTSTITNYIERSPTLQKALYEIEEDLLDLAESKMLTGVKNGERPYVLFYLRTKGKRRGYTEGAEVTGPDGGPLITDYSKATDEELLAVIGSGSRRRPKG